MPHLSQETIRLLDDLNDLDVIEVHYLSDLGDVRTVVGSFNGFSCNNREWHLRLVQKPAIRTIDVVGVRRLKKLQTAE